MVEDDEIQRILHTSMTLEEKADSLIELANKNGGQDNISVILIAIE